VSAVFENRYAAASVMPKIPRHPMVDNVLVAGQHKAPRHVPAGALSRPEVNAASRAEAEAGYLG